MAKGNWHGMFGSKLASMTGTSKAARSATCPGQYRRIYCLTPVIDPHR
jgi:hypothetical protein